MQSKVEQESTHLERKYAVKIQSLWRSHWARIKLGIITSQAFDRNDGNDYPSLMFVPLKSTDAVIPGARLPRTMYC